jgi:uncharacterized membrane protein YqjE
MRGVDRGLVAAAIILAVTIIVWLLPIPHSGIIAAAVAVVLFLMLGLIETGWQLFKDFRWFARWVARQFKTKRPP